MKKLAYFICIVMILITAIPLRAGRCTGSMNCSACSDCSRCAHCNSGGSCGVCSSRHQQINTLEYSQINDAAAKMYQHYNDSLARNSLRSYTDSKAQTSATHSGQATKKDTWVIILAIIILLYFAFKKLN